jgi:hypothetical protein
MAVMLRRALVCAEFVRWPFLVLNPVRLKDLRKTKEFGWQHSDVIAVLRLPRSRNGIEFI